MSTHIMYRGVDYEIPDELVEDFAVLLALGEHEEIRDFLNRESVSRRYL